MLEKYNLKIVGYVKKPYGFKGEVLIKSLLASLNDLLNLSALYISDSQCFIFPVWIEYIKERTNDYIAKFEQFDNRNQVEELSGTFLITNKCELKKISKVIENWHILEIKVFNQKKYIGIIDNVLFTSEYPILKVKGEEKEYFIPYHSDFNFKLNEKKLELYGNIPQDILKL